MSYTRFRYHFVVTTRDRIPWINEELEQFLYPVICRQFDVNKGKVIAIGGIEDHIHVIAGLRPEIAISSAIQNIKKDSSKAVRRKISTHRGFNWQIGYGGFTVNPFELDTLVAYVRNQKKHHGKNTLVDSYEPHLNSKSR